MGVDVPDRVCDAALVCLARWGLTKTTLEDVAREAGCGRATIYRTFRGGKSEVMGATLARELGRLRAEVGAAIEAAGPGDGPDDLEAVVVAGVVAAARFLRGHDALHYLLRHEPDVVLPWVSFDRVGIVYDAVAAFSAPHLARFVPDPEAAARAAERLTRVVLSYSVNPAEGIDLADPASARRLLSTYVIPGLVLAARPPSLEEQCPATPT